MLTFAIHLQDHPGALNRVASLFRRRAINIVSLTVGHTERPDVSRMTVTVDAPDAAQARIEANLYKLLDVEQVEALPPDRAVARDLALVKVAASQQSRAEIMQLVHVFRARVVDVAPESLIVEITGTEDKIDSLVEVLRPYGVIEMVRTGRVAMTRGETSLSRRALTATTGLEPVDLAAQSV